MDVLPPSIEILDANGRRCSPLRTLKRVDAPDSWDEKAWDQIIVENVELLAESLREADVIAEDATLKVLGTQIDNIDVVLAEVGQSERNELRRLVLLEDKLLSNPQAKRHVLAQILDYASTVQENWPTANLVEKFREHGPWVSENEDDFKRIARTAEFLLIVAGDGIDDSMERLARRFAGHDDPLSLSELALVSMPLYALDEQFLLIPHVVTAVQRRERGFTLRVVVQDYEGHEVAADARLDVVDGSPAGVSKRLPVREEVAEFLRKLQPRLSRFLPGVKETAKPRKSIEFWQKWSDETPILYKVHFGGYVRDVWTPIYVGVSVSAKDTAARDAWILQFQRVIDALPTGTVVGTAGPKTAEALKPVAWKSGDDLNRELEDSLANDFGRLVAAIATLPGSPGSVVASV